MRVTLVMTEPVPAVVSYPVMAGLVPAIHRGTVPEGMAGTGPAMTGKVAPVRVALLALTSPALTCPPVTCALPAPHHGASHA